MLPALAGLFGWSPNEQQRNANLNEAFLPHWNVPHGVAPEVPVPQGNTQFDPFLGTGWDKWLDAAGAGKPGGMNMKVSGPGAFGKLSPRHFLNTRQNLENNPYSQGEEINTEALSGLRRIR